MPARTFLTCSALVAALFALSACGRAGPLEPPPASVAAPQTQADDSGDTAEDRPFILDGLLQ